MFNQTIIVGRVGGDSEMRYTPDGIAVCNFTVAVNKKTGKGDNKKESTTWVKVTCWRERAETAAQYVKKGMEIMVVGEVKATAYLDKSGEARATLELTANDLRFLSGSEKSAKRENTAPYEDGEDEFGEMPF